VPPGTEADVGGESKGTEDGEVVDITEGVEWFRMAKTSEHLKSKSN